MGRSDVIARSLQIIAVVADLGIGTTAREIAQRLDLPAATTYRLLNNLVADEYLVRTADLRGFALGLASANLLQTAAPLAVPALARDTITQWRAGIPFGAHVVYFRPVSVRVLDADPDHPLVAERDLVRHLHASAAGKLLLASQSRWRDMLPTKLRAVTPVTLTDRGRLAAQIDAIRREDIAQDVGELVESLAAVAVPIMDDSGDVRGAVMVCGPVERIESLRELAPQCAQLARTLGPLLF